MAAVWRLAIRRDRVRTQCSIATPAQLDAHLRAEVPKWAKVINASGIKAE